MQHKVLKQFRTFLSLFCLPCMQILFRTWKNDCAQMATWAEIEEGGSWYAKQPGLRLIPNLLSQSLYLDGSAPKAFQKLLHTLVRFFWRRRFFPVP
jgi:hypothetical protein